MWKLALVLTIGLSTAATQASEISGSLMFDGKERTFLLHVPDKPDATAGRPLVVVLHFYPGTGRQMHAMTGFSEKADAEGFIVVYPDGLDKGWNALVCCGSADDVGFIGALVAHIEKSHAIDRKRIYATGISNGGDMSFKLAAATPDLFAAIGSVSGGLTGTERAVPSAPISLIAIHGGKDRWFSAFEEGVGVWTAQRKCGGKEAADEGAFTRRHLTCADGTAVEHYVVKEMGHSWPGGTEGGALSATSSPLKATDMIWDFFKAHARP